MALTNTIENIRGLINQISRDLDKAARGNKAASQRVRTGTIRLEKVAKLFRKESVYAGKSSKGHKKAAKKAGKKKGKKAVKKAVKKAPKKKKAARRTISAKRKGKIVRRKTIVGARALSVRRRRKISSKRARARIRY